MRRKSDLKADIFSFPKAPNRSGSGVVCVNAGV
jgi:hypothetical protein